MKKLKKLTRSQKEILVKKLNINSVDYLVERNTSEFIVFYNIKTNEKLIYDKVYERVVEEI